MMAEMRCIWRRSFEQCSLYGQDRFRELSRDGSRGGGDRVRIAVAFLLSVLPLPGV